MQSHSPETSAARTAQQRLKLEVAERAATLVESGMVVGLGSGSTATLWIRSLGERVKKEGLRITAVATSEESEQLARSYGIPFVSLEQCDQIDLTIDGADEIDPQLALIKGGGGKLLHEKIVASVSKRFIVIADSSKMVDTLGKFPLPVEVIPRAVSLATCALSDLGFQPNVRHTAEDKPYITEEGNLLLDCSGVAIREPARFAKEIDSIVGVVEHGLFVGMAERALIGSDHGVLEKFRTAP